MLSVFSVFKYQVLPLFLVLFPTNSWSQDEIIHYLQNNFKINAQTWGIQTSPSNGLVYFATNNGLLEYDGLTFTTWETPDKKMLRSIKIDSSERIYTGGFESFGYWEKASDCSLTYQSLSDSVEVHQNDEIWKIYLQNNKVVFQSFTAIYVYDHNSVEVIPSPGFMLFMFQVNNQLIVQILDKGLYYFENGTFTFIEGSDLFYQKKVHSIIPHGDTEFLVCTEKNGIYKKGNDGFIYWNTEVSEYLKYQNCNAAIKINPTVFAFGTILDGFVLTNQLGQILEHYNYGKGLNNNTVLSFATTIDNNLWVGLDEGINYINQSSNIAYYSTSTGSLGTIYTLLINNNKLYLGSNHGLFQSEIHQTGNSINFGKLSFIPNSQGQVWSLTQFGDQILCGHNEGTFEVNNNQFSKISSVTGGWMLKPYNDYLIEGTYTGLIVFKKDNTGKWQYYKRLDGFNEPSRHLEIDYLGYIWVSHPQKGIFQLKPNESLDSIVGIYSYTNLKKTIGLTDVFKLNNRVVFSTGKEFYTFDYVNNKMVDFDVLNNALGPYKQSSQIIPFEKNQYWFVNKNKVALFKISIEFELTKIAEYNIEDESMSGQDLAILPANNQNFILSNRNGFALLNRMPLVNSKKSSSVSIKSVVFYGKNKSITLCPNENEIKIPYYMNNVTFLFSDPSAANISSPQYQYRIKEIDDRWNSTQNHEILYFHLKPGNYHLEIANDTDSKPASTLFSITPPWYFNNWAYVIYFIITLAIVFLISSIIQNKLRKQRKLIEFEIKQTSLETRLQNTNVELMLTLRYLIQKNESLQNLRSEIEAVKNDPSRFSNKFIHKLDAQISQGLELQTKEWKMALHNLKLSQEGYFKMLKERYPKLTNNDIRLCSYLRMNFSSKEIAHLLNISTRSVEISRYRLRIKLSLNHDKSLSDFLMQEEIPPPKNN
jgi:DNA-binding CsgD family transcriptional regulator